MTHLPLDYHADHRTTAQVVEAAAMLATLANAPVDEPPLPRGCALYHDTTLNRTDVLGHALPRPHFFIDVTDVIETKRAMLRCHQSQQALMRHMHAMADFFETMLEANRQDGTDAGCSFAEAFWQHRGAGFPGADRLADALAPWTIRPSEAPRGSS